jgi:hypothetical protein
LETPVALPLPQSLTPHLRELPTKKSKEGLHT